MQELPAITSPAMRSIGVADNGIAASFYADILGFDIRHDGDKVEAHRGPARIAFGREDYSPTNCADGRPAGTAMIFLETDDLDAMHSAIRARGGSVSTIEQVNWIKMRMFCVRDPDGHTLWFGQSYNQPVSPAPLRQLREALPELPFTKVGAAIQYYREVLGFEINYSQEDLGVMYRDNITILLIQRTPQHKGISSFEVYIQNADALYAEFKAKGARLQGEPVSHPWGLRDFRVLDIEDNRITFAQTFE